MLALDGLLHLDPISHVHGLIQLFLIECTLRLILGLNHPYNLHLRGPPFGLLLLLFLLGYLSMHGWWLNIV